MTSNATALEASYAYCHGVARASRSNFYLAFLLLDRPKRRAMEALYAFMRHTDDLADNPTPVATRQAALAQWRADLTAALERGGELGPREPLLPALADTAGRFQIPPEHLVAVLNGVEMDLENCRYETFEQLAGYCRRVASAVGMACLHIWGFRSQDALEPADRCGLAFQLTNILRDLGEDARQGRVYLPLEELRQCDYAVEDLAAGVADARFLRVMHFQLQRAEQLYGEAVGLFDCLYPDGQRIFGMMLSVYHRLLEEIRKDPAAVLSRRVSLGRLDKTWLAARWLLWPPKRLPLARREPTP